MPSMMTEPYPTRPSGIVFVVSGPSGSGKGTVIGPVTETTEGLRYSVSVTTRKPREGEVDGVEYHFVTDREFDRLVASDGFLEHTEYAGHRYGTLAQPVIDSLFGGYDMLLEVEIEGAGNVRARIPNAVLILLIAPSAEELRRRLETRGTETSEQIAERVAEYGVELSGWSLYDYLIVNEDAETASADLAAIVRAERLRCRRLDVRGFIRSAYEGEPCSP